MRSMTFVISVVFFAGCHAPAPSIDALTPTTVTRVPAPATGSVGAAGGYYQSPASSAAPGGQTPLVPSMQRPMSTSGAAAPQELPGGVPPTILGESDPLPSNNESSSRVSLASFQSGAPSSDTGAARSGLSDNSDIVPLPQGTQDAASGLKLKGMPVNDATQVGAEPTAGIPSGSYQPPSFLRIMSPKTKPTDEANVSVPSGSWQTRQ